MKAKIFLLLAILLIGFLSTELSAQCAMCKMAAEDGVKDGNTQSAGLNSGILYLLVMPYLAVAVIGYLWWKNFKRKKLEEGDI